MELRAGTAIEQYSVLEHVGTGTAEVYRAVDERLGRPVAIKVLRGSGESLRREADALRTLHHPCIVELLDVLEYDGRLALVQEWVGGGSLADRLGTDDVMSVSETVTMARQVAAALQEAHRHMILHRDIKPSNVLRTVGGDYKLADFGAVGTLAEATGRTQSGVVAGTPLYMSPEQVTGSQQSPASDLFGLGLVIYRCVHGSLPGGGAGTYVQLATSRLQQIPVPTSPLQPLLQRLLHVDPTQRPQTAAEVLDGLDALASAPVDQVEVATQSASAGSEPATAPPRPARSGHRSTPVTLVVGLALLTVVLVAVVMMQLFLGKDEPPPIGEPPTGGSDSDSSAWWALSQAVAGIAVICLALAAARLIRQRGAARAPETEKRAASVIFGAQQRDELSASLMIEVDEVVRNLNTVDAKILGMTVVAMIHQFEDASKWSHKQQALLDLVTLMEKLQQQLAPWHVRHKDAIATSVAVVGALTGVAAAVGGLIR